MPRLASFLALLLLGLAPASAQSLYDVSPGFFAAVERFGYGTPAVGADFDTALGGEVGYRLSNGLDLSLGLRYGQAEGDYGSGDRDGFEVTVWYLRPTLGHTQLLGRHVGGRLTVRLDVSVLDEQNVTGLIPPTSRHDVRYDADLAAMLFGRMPMGHGVEFLPSLGAFLTETVASSDAEVEVETGSTAPEVWVQDRSQSRYGIRFALPLAIHFGSRVLVLEPVMRYAITQPDTPLHTTVDLSVRFNF